MRIVNTEKLPIKMWLNDIEDWAMEQVKNLANLPFLYKWVAIMPDSHQWYGMPIGWVIATKWVVIPNAVWVDIGCWMCAIKTSLTSIDKGQLKVIMWKIREAIPVWFNHNNDRQDEHLMPDKYDWEFILPIVEREYESALYSLGTLGWWNHFIEIQSDTLWWIWIMIHSWSRNFWLKIAEYYNKLAIWLNEKWFSSVPKKQELAFLPLESEEWKSYMREMQYAVDYALANRKLMMDRIKEIFKQETNCEFWDMINIAHNYARIENHFWQNVVVHRKGATSAREWEMGIIPWSQWTASYIVRWLGNRESFESCSHWAGRKMWRNEACKKLVLEDEIKKLDDQWIIHWIRHQKDLDEASWAYKDIDEVMENQKELVEIIVKLTPLAVIKG